MKVLTLWTELFIKRNAQLFVMRRREQVHRECHLHPRDKYPWLDSHNILELHHILPLSATLNVNGTTTTLDDLRPLCPTCHRSIHIFYKNKLNEWDLPDFSSKKMATDVYELAKRTIIN